MKEFWIKYKWIIIVGLLLVPLFPIALNYVLLIPINALIHHFTNNPNIIALRINGSPVSADYEIVEDAYVNYVISYFVSY